MITDLKFRSPVKASFLHRAMWLIAINDLPRYLPQVARWCDPAIVWYDLGPPLDPEETPPASLSPSIRPRCCYHRFPVMCSHR